eukprot:1068904-Amphidinium_carterae.1
MSCAICPPSPNTNRASEPLRVCVGSVAPVLVFSLLHVIGCHRRRRSMRTTFNWEHSGDAWGWNRINWTGRTGAAFLKYNSLEDGSRTKVMY